jgi:hypothetical protein
MAAFVTGRVGVHIIEFLNVGVGVFQNFRQAALSSPTPTRWFTLQQTTIPAAILFKGTGIVRSQIRVLNFR